MEQLKNPALSRLQNAGQNTSKASPTTVSRGIQFLFSAYRKDDFADPEGFVAQLGVVLSDFPAEIVEYVTSPRTGLQRRSKWPPTINEILEACEQHREYLTKVKTSRAVSVSYSPPVPLLKDLPAGSLAQVFVPEGHSRYAALLEWTKKTEVVWWKFGKSSDGRNGLWVSHNAWATR